MDAEMQGGVAAHRMADDMSFLDSQSIENGGDIGARYVLTITVGLFRHTGWRIPALTKSDASMRAGEIPELRLLCPVVPGEFVNENDGTSYPDPRGWSEFARMLAEHSALGHANTMFGVQLKRPTLWEMQTDLARFTPPLLVIVGDEDEPCLEGSFFLNRAAPTAVLQVMPRTGHNVTSEEPAAFNAALADLFAAAESGRWHAHKKAG
jgi:pimeloyl-ACP methyl ester carboxylesterase